MNVRLAITYEAIPNESSTKYIEVTQREASDFLAELNNGTAFPCLWSQGKASSSQQTKSAGILVEEKDVSEVGEGEGPKLQQWYDSF